jgi:hypothetical protein
VNPVKEPYTFSTVFIALRAFLDFSGRCFLAEVVGEKSLLRSLRLGPARGVLIGAAKTRRIFRKPPRSASLLVHAFRWPRDAKDVRSRIESDTYGTLASTHFVEPVTVRSGLSVWD